jgi:hypothetical protein
MAGKPTLLTNGIVLTVDKSVGNFPIYYLVHSIGDTWRMKERANQRRP